jgi:uncharacterized membrane protein
MTSATFDTDARRHNDAGLALAGYVLLTVSVFAAGIPALAAVALAYWRRDRATPGLRRHFARQIVIFWIAVLLLVIASALAIGGIVTAAATVVHVGVGHDWTTLTLNSDHLAFLDTDFDRIGLSTPVAGLFIGSLGAWALSGLWLFLAPIVGAIGLARSPLMGDRGR